MYRTVLRERRLPVDRTERASKRPLLLGGISNPGECDCALRGLLRALEGSRDPDRRDDSADGDWGGGTDTVGARVDVGVPRDDDDGGGGGAAETEPWLRCANRDKKLLAAEGVSREPAPPTLLDTSTGSHTGTINRRWGDTGRRACTRTYGQQNSNKRVGATGRNTYHRDQPWCWISSGLDAWTVGLDTGPMRSSYAPGQEPGNYSHRSLAEEHARAP